MDFVQIDESIKAAQSRLAAAVAEIKEGDVAPDDVWMQMMAPIHIMRDQARQYLTVPESLLDASSAVADWSKPNFESAVQYGDRYVSQLKACKRYLEIADFERNSHPTVKSQEEINALIEFNDGVRLAFRYAIIIKRFAEAEHAAQHPVVTGPGPFGSTPGVPGYFASAIDEINGKLDRILAGSQPGAEMMFGQTSTMVADSEVLTLLREIAAWVRTQQGTGAAPVVAIEGIVGGLVERYPWHSTAGVVGIYGGPGQPKDVVGLWQYDALYEGVLTGSYIQVSTPLRDIYQTRKTLVGGGRFWISVGSATIPRAPVDVVISDINTQGNRVIQRLQV